MSVKREKKTAKSGMRISGEWMDSVVGFTSDVHIKTLEARIEALERAEADALDQIQQLDATTVKLTEFVPEVQRLAALDKWAVKYTDEATQSCAGFGGFVRRGHPAVIEINLWKFRFTLRGVIR